MSSGDIQCKGCISYGKIDPGYSCELPPKYNSVECPCLTCLVKGVCDLINWRNCEKIVKYNDVVFKK